MNKKALEQLAKSSYWKLVVEEYIRPRIHELTYSGGMDSSLPAEEFKIEILARQIAYEHLEKILEDINAYDVNLNSNIDVNQYK